MNDNDNNDLGRDLLRTLLAHPETVVVVADDGRLRLAYSDELEPAQG